MTPIADAIKAAREKAGKTQEEVAKAAGVPLSTYRTYERGTATPPADRADKIRGALGILAPAPARTLDDWDAENPGTQRRHAPLILADGRHVWFVFESEAGVPLRGYTWDGESVPLGTAYGRARAVATPAG